MLASDQVLIDPSAAALGRALNEAAAAANCGYRARLLKLPPKDRRAFRAEYQAKTGGWREWRNEGPSQSKSFSAVGVAWWSDRLGRKHVRIAGARPSNYDSDLNVFGLDQRPPLGLVYPDRTFLRERKGRKTLVAACPCGAWGEPRALGWMGDCCGACYKRRQHGETIPGTDFPARTVLDCPAPFLKQLLFTADSRTLLVRPEHGGKVYQWDLATGVCRVLSFPHPSKRPCRVVGLALAPDGRTAAVAWALNGGLLWRLDSTDEGPALQTQRHLSSLTFSPDGARLAALATNGSILRRISDVLLFDSAGRLAREVSLGRTVPEPTQGLAFAPDGRLLAAGSGGDEPVLLLDPATGKEQARLSGHFSNISSLAWSPDGTAVAAGHEEWNKASLRVWRWPGGKELFTAPDAVSSVAFSPDGRLLAAVGGDEPLRLWRVKDGKLIDCFRWHGEDMAAVAFSPDGRWLATGDDNGLIRPWPVHVLAGRRAPLT